MRGGDRNHQERETPGGPWELVEMDIFVWDKMKYLTVIDRFSKVAWVRIMPDKTAVNITELTILQLVS